MSRDTGLVDASPAPGNRRLIPGSRHLIPYVEKLLRAVISDPAVAGEEFRQS